MILTTILSIYGVSMVLALIFSFFFDDISEQHFTKKDVFFANLTLTCVPVLNTAFVLTFIWDNVTRKKNRNSN